MLLPLFFPGVTPAFAAEPLQPGRPLVANVSNSSFDVVLLLEEPAECTLRFGFSPSESQWSPENVAKSLFPSGPASLHWLRVHIEDAPEDGGFVYFKIDVLPYDAPFRLRLPPRGAPSEPASFFEATVLTAQRLPPREPRSLVLARLADGVRASSFRAAFFGADERQVRFSLDGLRESTGKIEPGGLFVCGDEFPPSAGETLQVVFLVEGRPPAFFETAVLDARAGVYEPPAGEIVLSLGTPKPRAAAASANGLVTLRWEAVPDTAGYLVQRSANGGEWETAAQLGALESPRLRQEGLAWGVWRWRVRALGTNGGQDGAWSDVVEVRVLPPPEAAPAVPASSVSHSPSTTVSWEGVPSPAAGADYFYEVEWSASPDFAVSSRFTVGSPQAALPLGGGTWYWRVRAVLPCGDGEIQGPWSQTGAVVVRTGTPVADAPQFVSSPRFVLTWGDVPAIPENSAVLYRVQLARSPDFSDAVTAAETEGTYASLWLDAPGLWYARVRAETGAGPGDWSDPCAVYFEPSPRAAPGELRCFPTSAGVLLAWDVRAAPDVPQTVQRRRAGEEWTTAAEGVLGDNWGDAEGEEGELLEYRVGAVYPDGTEWSQPAAVRLPVRVSDSAPAALAACGDERETLASAWFPGTDYLGFLMLRPGSFPAVAAEGEAGTEAVSGGGLPSLAAARVGEGRFFAFHTAADEFGMREPHLVEISSGETGATAVAPRRIGPEWTDATAMAAACDGDGLCCLLYYDALSEGYFLFEGTEEGVFRGPRFILASGRGEGGELHRPVLAFDEDGNLHFALCRADASGEDAVYGVMVRLEGDEPLSEPDLLALPLEGRSPLFLTGMSASRDEVLVALVCLSEGTPRLSALSGRPAPGGGMEWEARGPEAWGVEKAVTIFPEGRPLHLATVRDETAGGDALYAFYEGEAGERSVPLAAADSIEALAAVPKGKGAAVLFSDGGGLHMTVFEPGSETGSSPSGSNGGSGGCFIATAAFGSMSAQAVRGLSKCRDEALLSSLQGEGLVRAYYRLSAPCVRRATPALKAVFRRFLDDL